jgi:diadenosine tetraphosphatase ApaH/serine/threonine PP2A family protein phosphatase
MPGTDAGRVSPKYHRGGVEMSSSRLELTIDMLVSSYDVMMSHFEKISLEEALYVPRDGYRSVLGTLKHAAGWSHVYRSYAFDDHPKHWKDIDWPYGLRDTVIKSEAYLSAVIEWFREAHRRWLDDLAAVEEGQVEELRPAHWGEEAPLFDIVTLIARHHVYHAGELNQVLSICRGEAWEEGEEVEENNISTVGHRVKPPWLA